MDKLLGIFTTIFVGIPLTVISLLIARYMDDEGRNNEQSDNDNDMRILLPSRFRDRGSNHRRIKQVDEEGREIK